MTDPLSTQAARLLEIQEDLDLYSPASTLATHIRWLLAELTAAEAERDRLKAEHNEASTRAAYTIIALIAERDSYKDQLTAAREALRQLVKQWRATAVDERGDNWNNTEHALVWKAIHDHRAQVFEVVARQLETALGASAVPQEKP